MMVFGRERKETEFFIISLLQVLAPERKQCLKGLAMLGIEPFLSMTELSPQLCKEIHRMDVFFAQPNRKGLHGLAS